MPAPIPSQSSDDGAPPVSSAALLLPDASDTRALRVMKIVVIVLGIALVLGFFTVIGRMIYLTSRTDASGARPAAAGATLATMEATLPVPAGHEVRSIALDGNRLAVHLATPGSTAGRLSVIDLASGKVTHRITLAPEPAKP